jgi:hypothetical protein
MRHIFMAVVLLTAFPGLLWATYTDEIAVSQDEVWPAVLQVVKAHGMRKSNEKKKTAETQWMYDRVVRSRGPLKKAGVKQEYERRYRLKIKLQDRVGDTVVEVRGVFFEKPVSPTPVISWRKVKPERDDLNKERDFFMDILRQLEKNR